MKRAILCVFFLTLGFSSASDEALIDSRKERAFNAYIQGDYFLAEEMFILSCRGDYDAESCYQLGMMLYTGDNIRQNKMLAKLYFIEGCKLKHTNSCVMVNKRY